MSNYTVMRTDTADALIHKIIPPDEDSQDSIVIYEEFEYLAYCGLGYDRWIYIPSKETENCYKDVMFHDGRAILQIHVVSHMNIT